MLVMGKKRANPSLPQVTCSTHLRLSLDSKTCYGVAASLNPPGGTCLWTSLPSPNGNMCLHALVNQTQRRDWRHACRASGRLFALLCPVGSCLCVNPFSLAH